MKELKLGSGRVIINRNICDNAPECSGIAICPTGALHWDEDNELIAYDRTSCIDCGMCADEDAGGCPIGAILWGTDDEDYTKKWNEVCEETRKLEDLEIERYGASPIAVTVDLEDLNDELLESNTDYVLVEFFSDDSINCLLHSIPIKDIESYFINSTVYHFKVKLDDLKDVPYGLEELPSLAVFSKDKLIGKIDGYYDDSENSKRIFLEKVSQIIKKDK